MCGENVPNSFNFYGRLEYNSFLRNGLFNFKLLGINSNGISTELFRWPSMIDALNPSDKEQLVS